MYHFVINRWKPIVFLFTLISIISCFKKDETKLELRRFETSFENVSDFDGFYITPQGHLNTSYHEQSDSNVFSGKFAHKAWITDTNENSTPFINNNHRAYPTIQLHKTKGGSFKTPCYITFKVWIDMELNKSTSNTEDDWLSLATLSSDDSDNWKRTVLANIDYNGHLHLMHVPSQGMQNHIFQNKDLVFPQKEWVEVKIFIDFGENAYAKVWQNGTLVSHAALNDVQDQLAQAHFGLYCPPYMKNGTILNDDLVIEMVETE